MAKAPEQTSRERRQLQCVNRGKGETLRKCIAWRPSPNHIRSLCVAKGWPFGGIVPVPKAEPGQNMFSWGCGFACLETGRRTGDSNLFLQCFSIV